MQHAKDDRMDGARQNEKPTGRPRRRCTTQQETGQLAKLWVGNGQRNGRDGDAERETQRGNGKRDGGNGNVGRRAHDATGKRTVRTEALSE